MLNPSNGVYTLSNLQLIHCLMEDNSDSLLTWVGSSETYYDVLKNSYSSWEEKP